MEQYAHLQPFYRNKAYSRFCINIKSDLLSSSVSSLCTLSALRLILFPIQDKRATAHPSVINQLTGQVVDDAGVVIDGKLITSRGLGTAMDFSLAIVSKLFGHARARSVAEGLVFDYPRTGTTTA